MSFISVYTLTHFFCLSVVCALTCAVLFVYVHVLVFVFSVSLFRAVDLCMCVCVFVCVCMCACVWLPLLIYFPHRSPQRSLPPSAPWFPMLSFLLPLPVST